MTLAVTTAHRAARNQASIDLADAGAGPSSLRFYDAPAGTLLAVRHLAKPCGSLTPQGRIVLHDATAHDLVLASGLISWATWCDGDGQVIASGAVTDDSGGGPFRLQGSTGTMVYAGGLLLLGQTMLLG